VAGPFLGRLALMISARHIEARVTTLATLMTPAMTLALGFILLSDWPETYELIGGAIMIAGVAIPLLGFGRTRAPGN
jgi:drug/metabolite transporter (DMT)-like permease